ncbi:MAG: MlaD family protein [Alphaproteobacteria bacterium]
MGGGRKDALVGALVVLVGAVFLGVAYGSGADRGRAEGDSYVLLARFSRSDGLGLMAEVRVAGMPVGKVIEQRLTDDFHSLVTMRIRQGVYLPTDTAAVIRTDSLLGAKFVELEPGGDEAMLAPGARLELAQDSMLVEDLLARILAKVKAARRPSGDTGAMPREDGGGGGT